MKNIDYKNLKKGAPITVVTAWMENTTFEDVADGHFFKTEIENVYFEPRGDLGYLRIFALDGDGRTRRVNYVLQDGEIVCADIIVALDQLTGKSEMICLSNRKKEFIAALNRAEKWNLEVFADFDPDSFVVVNHDNGQEYQVKLESKDGHVFAGCRCDDFKYQRRICKHLSAVLADAFFGVLAKYPNRQTPGAGLMAERGLR